MKLAIRKDTSGTVPMGGFYYTLHPMAMKDDFEAAVFEKIGYIIAEVENTEAEKLLEEARKALLHQYQVAVIAEKALDHKPE